MIIDTDILIDYFQGIEKAKMRTAKCKMKSWARFDVRRATNHWWILE